MLWPGSSGRRPNLRPPAERDLGRRRRSGSSRDGAVALVVLLAAYVLAAPYSLPWYDASAWAPLALVAGGALDAVLLVRLVAYAVAYVPGPGARACRPRCTT